jgi:drug/metabolite transporter (DMT)-like permease
MADIAATAAKASLHRSALLFALAGFGCITVADALVKSIAGEWPSTAVAALRFIFGAIGLTIGVAIAHGHRGFRWPNPALQIGRGLAMAAAALGFFCALQLMPLAAATAIQFTTPVLTALLSALLLRESTSRVTWLAGALAFAGTLVVLRPNVSDYGVAPLFAVAAAVAMALLMIFNRKAAGLASPLAMQWLVSVVAAPILIAGAIAGHFSGFPALRVDPPSWDVVLRCAGVAVMGTVSHLLIYLATIRASAATIAPMLYVQLLTSVLIGWLFFGERPDIMTFVGAGLIVLAGLWLWNSQRPGAV